MRVRRLSVHAVRAGLVAAVVAIVLGILGMHALNLHDATTMAPMSGTTGMSGHHEATNATALSDHVSQESLTAPTQPGHDMGDMVMLCAAMIIAAGFALLALLLLRRVPTSSWTFTRSHVVSTVRRRVQERADSGPPPAWAFSVIRC